MQRRRWWSWRPDVDVVWKGRTAETGSASPTVRLSCFSRSGRATTSAPAKYEFAMATLIRVTLAIVAPTSFFCSAIRGMSPRSSATKTLPGPPVPSPPFSPATAVHPSLRFHAELRQLHRLKVWNLRRGSVGETANNRWQFYDSYFLSLMSREQLPSLLCVCVWMVWSTQSYRQPTNTHILVFVRTFIGRMYHATPEPN